MIFVDSSVWIDFFNGRTTPQTQKLVTLLGERAVLVGDVILYEVLLGARSEEHARVLAKAFGEFDCVPVLDPRLAIVAAANYRKLRAAGLTIRKMVDLIIGTYCLEYGHELLHCDRDFDFMQSHLGLRVVQTRTAVHEPSP